MTADASDRPADKPTYGQGSKVRWSIAAKLTAALLVLVIVPVCVVAHHVSIESQREVSRVARENLVAVAHESAGEIAQVLTAYERTSARLATEPIVFQFLATSEDEREALSPELYQCLRTLADAHPDCDAPGLLDVNGIVVASLEDALLGKDRSFRDYFQASIKGEPYVSGMIVGRGTGRPGVFLTNPVTTPEGEIVGISLIWLKADTIWRIIDQVKVGNAGIAYLVDQDGVIIAHPDRGMLYHSLGALAPDAGETISSTIRFGSMAGSDAALIPKSLGMDELAAELASDSGSGTHHHCGRDRVVGYARVEGYPLTVVVDVPASQFLAPMVRLGRTVWLLTALMAAFALIIGSWVVRRMTRPMRRLTRVMVAMEGGRPFEPSDIEGLSSGHDEVAHLSGAFGSMATAVRERQERITHLNAVLRAIRDINQLITQERNPKRLLQGACDALIETRGYFSAWIARLDEDGGFRGAFHAGVCEEAFARLVVGIERGEFPQCMNRALAEPDMPVMEDTVATCGDCPLVVDCAGEAGAAARLEHDGRVYGVLAISVPGHMAGSEDERSLLAEVATDIALGLHAIEAAAHRDRAEEALRRSAREWRGTFDAIPDFVFVVDRNHRVLQANRSTHEAFPDLKLGATSCHEMMHGTDAPPDGCPGSRVFLTGAPAHAESYEEHLGGIWLEIWAWPIFGEDGAVERVVHHACDITELKRAERDVEDARDTAQGYLDVAGVMFVALDSEGRVSLLNPKACEILGCSEDEALGKDWFDTFLLAEDRDATRAVFGSLMRGEVEVVEYHENPVVSASGAERLIAWHNRNLTDESGNPTGVLSSGEDVTEHRAAEEARDSALSHYRLLADNTQDAIWTMDMNMRFTYVNPAVADMVGYSPEEWVGTTLADHAPPEAYRDMAGLASEALASGVEFPGIRFESIILHRDGHEISVEIDTKMIYDENGKPVSLQGVTRDITERKQAEEALQRLNEELEQRVVERTAELEAVNEELEAFAHSVSHDLRAPLRGMAGFSVALLEDYDDKLDEQGRDYLVRMDAAGNRMGQLIDDLLTLSRVTRAEMSRETVDLTSLVNEMAAEMREREPDRDVAFAVEPAVTVDGDRRLLQVLLTNLLDNAWKFTGKQPAATIEFGTTEIGGETVCHVRDNGAGFDMAYVGKLFGPFQRLHRMDEFPGTGIGLATVQRIINRHGGRVWAEGEVGKGAAIYFTLQRGWAGKDEGDV